MAQVGTKPALKKASDGLSLGTNRTRSVVLDPSSVKIPHILVSTIVYCLQLILMSVPSADPTSILTHEAICFASLFV